ncbi:helix-turn-helix domain-containing protein [Mammaliicoccus sciuri]|uniref:helix-turn-helix domain-containing protein n=1 Tax=Mammaliicoccus sciuri TaxID=1296 RepID=UPI0019522C45|nr:helix-turn-helix transcriptional regulator [Mammaliicoccus sciuri]MCJ1776335.1 helix-turn-helix domain-containing protein [Mammaliicoccus sciuri]
MMNQKQLGNLIRTIRTKNNLDQKSFSKSIGSTVSALSNWENGRNYPKTEYLEKISRLYSVPLSYLTKSTKERITEIVNELENETNRYEEYKVLYDVAFKFKLIDDITALIEERQVTFGFYTDQDIRTIIIDEIHKKDITQKYEPFTIENAQWFIEERFMKCENEVTNILKSKNVDEKLIKQYQLEFYKFKKAILNIQNN